MQSKARISFETDRGRCAAAWAREKPPNITVNATVRGNRRRAFGCLLCAAHVALPPALAITMYIPELQALLDKVEPLKSNPTTSEVYEYVSDAVAQAKTPSMAQSVCSQVITMCHPKAWGDMYVEGYGETWVGWMSFLSELAETANTCGQLIYENHPLTKGSNG